MLASVLLAALVPQVPAVEEVTPAVTVARAQESGDLAGFQADPAAPEAAEEAPEPPVMETPELPAAPAAEPPAMEATPAAPAEAATAMPSAAPTASIQQDIETGLKAFIRGRFSTAREAFQRAYDADPQSAAAAFYLGYACYKVGEPSARMNADKEKARELFARAYSLDPAFEPVWGRKPASE